MKKDSIPDIEAHIFNLFEADQTGYLTTIQIRDRLPAASLKFLGLNRKSASSDVLQSLHPFLGNSLRIFKSDRFSLISKAISFEQILLDKVRKCPGISSKQLIQQLPIAKNKLLDALNRMLENGSLICRIDEDHIPGFRVPNGTERVQVVDDRMALKQAYNEIGKGRGFVRIHSIRDYLKWDVKRFDPLLKRLMAQYIIELHGGDPSGLSDEEIAKSFLDEQGTLYITLTWWGKNE